MLAVSLERCSLGTFGGVFFFSDVPALPLTLALTLAAGSDVDDSPPFSSATPTTKGDAEALVEWRDDDDDPTRTGDTGGRRGAGGAALGVGVGLAVLLHSCTAAAVAADVV